MPQTYKTFVVKLKHKRTKQEIIYVVSEISPQAIALAVVNRELNITSIEEVTPGMFHYIERI